MPKVKVQCTYTEGALNGPSRVEFEPIVAGEAERAPGDVTGGRINLHFADRSALAGFTLGDEYVIEITKAK